ncbi:hypothetical protein HanHA300_Chr17g0653891 [Helianthus annuus]|nr:hypothetical protein HanHA300_Chr17g0653891 [Helianthus annuus]KAJ0447490.1 hypothetical protein HanHA89_Chr17g0705981 [Helianthus annuus]KAJ0636257.1 hypothetical protein HanOQP8_Chr17g0659891 [Helianthus annuus]KAJ0824119.1 hypothetical protein HanLR1_Chr00c0070g0704051 [Helianthus annuus]
MFVYCLQIKQLFFALYFCVSQTRKKFICCDIQEIQLQETLTNYNIAADNQELWSINGCQQARLPFLNISNVYLFVLLNPQVVHLYICCIRSHVLLYLSVFRVDICKNFLISLHLLCDILLEIIFQH